jgi:hypothetical protein
MNIDNLRSYRVNLENDIGSIFNSSGDGIALFDLLSAFIGILLILLQDFIYISLYQHEKQNISHICFIYL